ncbi:MAG: ribbon-helix-helix protein, CopG family [Gammaproteobacteria bacterium]|nr:ribbon-helix-helix protein, CopG family [Gammaproteobacteria bacterium]MCF6260246.1 ribbon-helix-helix protein, CopG family [Gammaproteobacteria bacterium]
MLGVRLDPELEHRLAVLAKKTKRSKSYLAKEALRDYIDRQESQERRRQETLERWEAYEQGGETIGHDAMVDWLESWGEDEEKACPVIK